MQDAINTIKTILATPTKDGSSYYWAVEHLLSLGITLTTARTMVLEIKRGEPWYN